MSLNEAKKAKLETVTPTLEQLKEHSAEEMAPQRKMTSVCVTVDGKYVVTGSGDKTARVWRLDDGAHVRTLEGHSDYVSSVCVTTDGEYVVTGSMDYTTRVWRLCDGLHVHTLRLKSDWSHSVCVTPDNQYVVIGSYDKAGVWMLDGRPLGKLECQGVLSVCVTRDGANVVMGSMDNTIRVWKMNGYECSRGYELLHTLEGHSDWVNTVCVTPDNQHVVSASDDNTVRMWRLSDGENVRTLHLENSMGGVCVTPDGKYLVVAGYGVTTFPLAKARWEQVRGWSRVHWWWQRYRMTSRHL